MRSQLVGGPQEEGRRAGTENVASVLSMMAALKERETLLAETDTQEKEAWRNAFVMSLTGAKILGQGEGRLWNTVSALLPGDCRALGSKAGQAGFAVSTGSACASGRGSEPRTHRHGRGHDEADRVVRFVQRLGNHRRRLASTHQRRTNGGSGIGRLSPVNFPGFRAAKVKESRQCREGVRKGFGPPGPISLPRRKN